MSDSMRVGVVGSRSLAIDDLGKYLPPETSLIVTGGAKGIDTCAEEYALKNKIKLSQFKPQYDIFKRAAPLKRNMIIIQNSDLVLAFWNGKSAGTKHVIDTCKKMNVPVEVIMMTEN